jgi:two-component system, chemotaxis family, sensor kinase CheA
MIDFDVDRDAIVQTFLDESEEGLAAMEEAMIGLEARPDDAELVGTIFRVAHTLKGNAASLGFEGLVRFAHALEDLLDRVRARTIAVAPDVVGLLLRSVDALREIVPAAVSGHDTLTEAQEDLVGRLATRARRTHEASPAALADGDADDREGETGGSRRRGARGLRVDIGTLDRMLDLTGEIAIARNRLRRLLEESGATDRLEAQGEVDRLSVDLQELVMKVRLVPLRSTFRQHVRTVRDLCAAHGKQARLVLEGEDVEVDTSVIEHVRDPLTHMIRNAIDHGIETPEVRRARGKDPMGTIALRARHESGTIVIEIADDGAGLDRARIVERARAAGLGDDRLDDAQLQHLVFEPGFSTAEEVTELSGRGIGLDVVRRNIRALRGTIAIASRPGEGTTITLRLPLTLAIIDGFAVGVGEETYVIPLDAVAECLELPAAATSDGEGRGIVNLRGTALPYVRLRHLFGESGAATRQHVVVVRHDDGRPAGLVVDALHGDSQTVIKPLGRLFRHLSGIAGSAILPSGRVALILDVPALIGQALRRADGAPAADAVRAEAFVG